MITATMEKKTVSSAVKGSASVNALPMACSSVTPVKVVARMITDRPIRPTSASEKRGHDQPNANERTGNQPQSLLRLRWAAAIVKLLQHLAHRRR